MKQKEPLKTITVYSDVTEQFDPIKDDSTTAEVITLGNLKQLVDDLIIQYGSEAEISAALEGDEYYPEWHWAIVTYRPETLEEQKFRLQRDADAKKEAERQAKKREQEEKKLYLKLKKKYDR